MLPDQARVRLALLNPAWRPTRPMLFAPIQVESTGELWWAHLHSGLMYLDSLILWEVDISQKHVWVTDGDDDMERAIPWPGALPLGP